MLNDGVELLNARRELERARVEHIIQLRANTTDSMRLYHVAAPYLVGAFVGSLYVVVAIANLDLIGDDRGLRFVFVGAALPVGMIVIGLCVLFVIEIANEWDLARIFRDKIRADVAGDTTVDDVMPDFPPRWFVELLRDHYTKVGKLPGIDKVAEVRKAQDNFFNRERAEQMYLSLIEWGAITGREPHGKSAGIPAWTWDQMLDHAT